MIIDLEHHISMGRAQEQRPSPSHHIVERQKVSGDGRVSFDHLRSAPSTEQSVRFMDEAGIDMAVRTSNASGVGAREANDMMAKAVRDYPQRYIGEAAIPIVDGKRDLDELDRAINGLGLKGVHIYTRTADLYLDSREMWPFYEKVSKLNVPIDVHVDVHIAERGFDELRAPYALHYVMAREFDMASSVLRVCLGGVLEDFPDLVLIMNHFGGGVSSLLERLDLYWDLSLRPGGPDFFYEDKRLISRHWREYFNKLYFNMAGRGVGMDAVKCALTNISPEKLMFATDWPFNYDGEPDEARRYIAEIRKLDLPQEDIDGMLGGNAARLFGIQE